MIMNLPVTFHCSADSVPPPVLTLRFKNLVLGNFSNIGAFTIKQVKASDQGMYECVPSNIIGMGVTATLNLTILGKHEYSIFFKPYLCQMDFLYDWLNRAIVR